MIGKLFGAFGWESKHAAEMDDRETTMLMVDTKRKMKDAGFEGLPAWHFQYEPDH